MSEETRLLVERLLAAYSREEGPDFDAVGEIISDDHVFVPAGEVGEVDGRRGYMRWFRDINESMPMRYDGSGAIDCGPGRAIGVISTHYRSATSGVESVQRMWIVFTVADGRVIRSEAYTTPEAALEAAKG